jgi:integrase
MFHVVTRANGKLVREPVGHNKKNAERALRRIQVEHDEGRFEEPRNLRFDLWADEWLHQLRRRSTTRAGYEVTLRYAKEVFGSKPLRRLKPSDVQTMLTQIEDANRARRRTVSPSTLAKHLRQLGACLQAAEAEGLIPRNPVRMLHKSTKPKAPRTRPSYFTDAELRRLWPEIDNCTARSVCQLAVTTGMRFGEIAGLRSADVSLLAGEIRIRAQFTDGEETTTKDNDPRTVDLAPQAQRLLEDVVVGRTDVQLVFESDRGEHIDNGALRDMLYAAMRRAGIPREGTGGRKRTFHSFRNTFARIALENGAELSWVQRQLGHSTISLTNDVYGHWSREAEKLVAKRLEGAFAV